jgi:hypothetical protein
VHVLIQLSIVAQQLDASARPRSIASPTPVLAKVLRAPVSNPCGDAAKAKVLLRLLVAA